MEIWKTIPSFPSYEASNLGRVRRAHATYSNKRDMLYAPKGDGVLTQQTLPFGYLVVSLRHGNKGRTRLAHRMVCEAFLGPAPDGVEVNHINAIRSDNRIENLEYVTREQNIADRTRRGVGRGSANSQAKLTEAQVVELRALHAAGSGYKALGKKFGISWSVARNIIKRKTWNHV